MIHCLMVSGMPLSTELRETLYEIAKSMTRSQKQKKVFKMSYCEGVVTTKGEHVNLAALSGMHFQANIEFETRTTRVSFIVSLKDLESDEVVVWETMSPRDNPCMN